MKTCLVTVPTCIGRHKCMRPLYKLIQKSGSTHLHYTLAESFAVG
jgi:hypothetical protein